MPRKPVVKTGTGWGVFLQHDHPSKGNRFQLLLILLLIVGAALRLYGVNWDENHHLVESARAFHSLDELLAHCLSPPTRHLVDRVTITGRDAQGRRRQLVLAFQALTEP